MINPDLENAYAPPEHFPEAPRNKRASGYRLTVAYACLLALGGAVLGVLGAASPSPLWAGIIARVGWALAVMRIAVGLAWLHASWSSVPRESRGTMTPGGAVGWLFCPIFNAYFVFKTNTLLCSAIDGILARERIDHRAPKALVVLTTILFLVCFRVVFRLDPFGGLFMECAVGVLWLTYMRESDRTLNIMRLAIRAREEHRLAAVAAKAA